MRTSDSHFDAAATASPALESVSVLQSLILPDPEVPDRPGLCYRALPGHQMPKLISGSLRFEDDAAAGFDTWFNLFDSAAWRRLTDVEETSLRLTGKGRLSVEIHVETVDGKKNCTLRQQVELDAGAVDLRATVLGADILRAWFTLKAHDGTATLDDAHWIASAPASRAPILAICITTFRRENAAESAIARIRERFGEDEAVRLIVVDNGGTLPCRESSDGRLRVLHNPNLGGAGGFARGLIEARAAGASHCLFMDDDVTLHLEAIARAYALLAHASDPATAVSGAMIDAARPWFLWEMGATYRRFCRPLELGRDLRDPKDLRKLALRSDRPAPMGFYGGWWFFAFPIDHVRHLPFPFFVRGDDVSFSLANRFTPATLTGVASFQENFTDKESPLTWYLDLRSHLAHQLSLPGDGRGGALACLKIIVWFAMRNMVRMHYDTLDALALAVEDVLEGPDHLATQGDLAERRQQIRNLTRMEAWQPADDRTRARRRRLSPHFWPTRFLMKLTLNGHLLPGFSRFGNHVIVTANQRGWLRPVWGASRATHLSRDRKMAYEVVHSKSVAFARMRRLAVLSWRLWRQHGALQSKWREAYPRLTDTKFWTKTLGL